MMARLDRGRGRIKLVDIAQPGFDPGAYGRTMNDVMGSIHGVTPDGRVVSGPEVFRLAYGAVGWGWLWAPTGWPVLRPIFDRLYRVFARLRLKLTSHPDAAACAAAGRCKLPTRGTPAPGATADARA
jgi:predicted DCC family thiol-disulfide oxidoreductase YuxK